MEVARAREDERAAEAVYAQAKQRARVLEQRARSAASLPAAHHHRLSRDEGPPPPRRSGGATAAEELAMYMDHRVDADDSSLAESGWDE